MQHFGPALIVFQNSLKKEDWLLGEERREESGLSLDQEGKKFPTLQIWCPYPSICCTIQITNGTIEATFS